MRGIPDLPVERRSNPNLILSDLFGDLLKRKAYLPDYKLIQARENLTTIRTFPSLSLRQLCINRRELGERRVSCRRDSLDVTNH